MIADSYTKSLSFVILVCLFASLAHAELKVGVGKAIITPDPLLPVSGGVGPGRPSTGKQGELTARVNRILVPQPPLPRAVQAGVVLAAAALVTVPLVLLVIP